MHSQNDKLLVVGDSNVGMCKSLLDADGELLGFPHVDFWYETGSAFNTVRINDGWVKSARADGLAPVRLYDYRHVLFAGGRLRVMPVFEQIINGAQPSYSASFIRTSVTDYIGSLPGYRKLRDIRDNYDGLITAFTTPLRGSGVGQAQGVASQSEGVSRTYHLIWEAYQQAFKQLDVELLPIPFSAIEAGYLVKAEYNLSDTDDLHKNHDYARLVLTRDLA